MANRRFTHDWYPFFNLNSRRNSFVSTETDDIKKEERERKKKSNAREKKTQPRRENPTMGELRFEERIHHQEEKNCEER